MSKKSRGRGRPALFNYSKRNPTLFEKNVLSVLAEQGIKYGLLFLANVGVQVKPGQKKECRNISAPTVRKLAKAHGHEFTLGRPAHGSAIHKLAVAAA